MRRNVCWCGMISRHLQRLTWHHFSRFVEIYLWEYIHLSKFLMTLHHEVSPRVFCHVLQFLGCLRGMCHGDHWACHGDLSCCRGSCGARHGIWRDDHWEFRDNLSRYSSLGSKCRRYLFWAREDGHLFVFERFQRYFHPLAYDRLPIVEDYLYDLIKLLFRARHLVGVGSGWFRCDLEYTLAPRLPS